MISVVIPAYNEEHRIRATLVRLIEFFESRGWGAEIIVVDDGSSDRTREVAREYLPGDSVVCFSVNRGKGAALRTGILRSKGESVVLVDADLPYTLDFLDTALPVLTDHGLDAVIGARDLPESHRDPSYPFHRVVMGRFFSRVVNRLLPVHVFDTQCGFKVFSGEMIRRAVLFSTRDDYTLDIELLLIFRLWKLRVQRAPVKLVQHHGSKVRPVHDSLSMLGNLLQVVWNHTRRRYPVQPPNEPFEPTACPACATEGCYSVVALVEKVYRFCRCRRCKTIYQNPRLSESLLSSQYQPSYFNSGRVSSGYPDYWTTGALRKQTARWLWDRLEGDLSCPVQNILDVGCGTGEFVLEAVLRGKIAWGTDLCQLVPDAPYTFVLGEFLDVELPGHFFDLIVFNDSFEHFPNPGAVLARCRRLLADSGFVVLNTPNPHSWLARLSGSKWISLKREHVALYPSDVLVRLLREHSFREVSRRASFQAADWNYIEPRLSQLSRFLARLGRLHVAGRTERVKMVPTGGIMLVCEISASEPER